MLFRTDIRVILYVESEYGIRFSELLLKFFRKIDFVQNMHVLKLSFLTLFNFKTPSSSKQVADPPKLLYF